MTSRGKSLFECINGLRYFGKGAHVTRSIYKFPETYYVLHRVILSKDQVIDTTHTFSSTPVESHSRSETWSGVWENGVERATEVSS